MAPKSARRLAEGRRAHLVFAERALMQPAEFQIRKRGRFELSSIVSSKERGRMTYQIIIEALDDEEGGGFVGRVPDLPGCVGDGHPCRSENRHRGGDRGMARRRS